MRAATSPDSMASRTASMPAFRSFAALQRLSVPASVRIPAEAVGTGTDPSAMPRGVSGGSPVSVVSTCIATAPQIAQGTSSATEGPTRSVVEDERHHHVDLVLGDVPVADVDALLLDPGTANIAQRLGRAGD